ncbi:hypothetical protein OSB04_004997 [Centaurea solstitialis]|uniref:TTF-type domain-containing protein n=1 Tax=Centaurea solstitialis TaxID=347529 RepID=A0AA38WG00_9ASTR|nr:hypothetical protein OSB04_004997 [Centaurea solstitialis]
MEKCLKRKAPLEPGGSAPTRGVSTGESSDTPRRVDVDDLPWDPSDRPGILTYDPDQRDEIRRLYWLRGPCQPRDHVFPTKMIGSTPRRFVPTWFDEFRWVEYSVKTDKAYCLCCYLFGEDDSQYGCDAFVTGGFSNWSGKERLSLHVGEGNSFHNRAQRKCEAMLQQIEREKNESKMRLNASIDVCRLLLKFGLPFRGPTESEMFMNQGLLVDWLKFLSEANETVRKVILHNGINQLTNPKIQKDIANCFAEAVVKSIVDEIGDDVFGLLVDESSDISKKKQMIVVLRHVDARGFVKDSLVGLLHLTKTTSKTLKCGIDALFAKLGLSLKQVRGQSYDGSSNMLDEFKGLKTLVLQDNLSAYYIHCFAQQLQLVVVAVAKVHPGVWKFFKMLSMVCNVVNGFCNRKEMVRESYKLRVQEAIGKGEKETGTTLNQELFHTQEGDTCWGSHHRSIVILINLFPDVVRWLEWILDQGDGPNSSQAFDILSYFQTFDFVFYLHLMLEILVVTNLLSKSLQKEDQNISEAGCLIEGTKWLLQGFIQSGFKNLLQKVESFCDLHNIPMLDMAEEYVNPIRTRQRTNITNRHHFECDVFHHVIRLQFQEFNDRFSKISTELIKNMAALSPRASFSEFNKASLVKLCEFYPYDFDEMDRVNISGELDLYYNDVHQHESFANLNSIDELARVMVETDKHLTYSLVYRLLKLALVLPIAKTSVDGCFSPIKLVKSYLCNQMEGEFLNVAVLCAVEKEAFRNVTNDDVLNHFQKMRPHQEDL